MTKSSFNGNISEIPFISVDNFTNLNRRAYFLSHCHTDHTEGLYSDEFLQYLMKNEDVLIYMSKPSAIIVSCETKSNKLMEYIKPLRIEKTLISIPGNVKNNIPDQYINVTLIPAGHCFGSVMFLYQTQHKTVLYTGDFRISTNSLSQYSQFIENGQVIALDTLYVDTTFQNHENFPKRSESIAYIVKEIKRFLDQGGCIALHTSAKYGYEAVCKEIYKQLGVKIYVNEYKWKLYSKFPDLGMTNSPNETRIHICSNRNEHMKSHERCLPTLNKYFTTPNKSLPTPYNSLSTPNKSLTTPTLTSPNKSLTTPNESLPIPNNSFPTPNNSLTTPSESLPIPNNSFPTPNNSLTTPNEALPIPNNSIPTPNNSLTTPNESLPTPNNNLEYLYIHFSALKWTNYQIDDLMIDKFANRIDVCFPTHCSRNELLNFISYFKVGNIVGFPEPFLSNGNIVELPEAFRKKDGCVRSKSKLESGIQIKVPKKVDKDLLKEIFD